MLSSPASGNYLFHEVTVTSVYLGQINREGIVTSPSVCLCLRSLSRCRSEGPAALPGDAGRSQPRSSPCPPSRSPSADPSSHHELWKPLQKLSIPC